MTDEQNDPRAQFLADQEAAEQEAATRDETQWALNVETVKADLAMKHAHTSHTEAKAFAWNALATLVTVTTTLGAVAAVSLGLRTAVRWFG